MVGVGGAPLVPPPLLGQHRRQGRADPIELTSPDTRMSPLGRATACEQIGPPMIGHARYHTCRRRRRRREFRPADPPRVARASGAYREAAPGRGAAQPQAGGANRAVGRDAGRIGLPLSIRGASPYDALGRPTTELGQGGHSSCPCADRRPLLRPPVVKTLAVPIYSCRRAHLRRRVKDPSCRERCTLRT